jgi:hypothetical protein
MLSAGCRFATPLSGALLTMVTKNSCSEVSFREQFDGQQQTALVREARSDSGRFLSIPSELSEPVLAKFRNAPLLLPAGPGAFGMAIDFTH